MTLSPIYILHLLVNIHHVMNDWNQSIVSWCVFVKPPSKYIAVHARLLAVSSSLVPGCSIRDDGANFPQEQFEQILQPLAEIERYLIVSKLLTKESHKTQCDSLLFLQSLYKLRNPEIISNTFSARILCHDMGVVFVLSCYQFVLLEQKFVGNCRYGGENEGHQMFFTLFCLFDSGQRLLHPLRFTVAACHFGMDIQHPLCFKESWRKRGRHQDHQGCDV